MRVVLPNGKFRNVGSVGLHLLKGAGIGGWEMPCSLLVVMRCGKMEASGGDQSGGSGVCFVIFRRFGSWFSVRFDRGLWWLMLDWRGGRARTLCSGWDGGDFVVKLSLRFVEGLI